MDGTENTFLVHPLDETSMPKTSAQLAEELRKRREAWGRIEARRTEVTEGWTSPLNATEVLEEQRAGRQKALDSGQEGLTGDSHSRQD